MQEAAGLTAADRTGWIAGLGRLCVVAAALAALLAVMPDVIRWGAARSIVLTGYGLLIGGYLSLGAVYLGVSWVVRGFAGPPRADQPCALKKEPG